MITRLMLSSTCYELRLSGLGPLCPAGLWSYRRLAGGSTLTCSKRLLKTGIA